MRAVRPFLLVNSGSGGGRTQDAILAAAGELGLDHHVAAPGDDFGQVLADAVADGADLLVAAGGDGTLCAVADVAMAHGLPMVVVPAGTRNHFALDLGLDLDDPVAALRGSLDGGHERRVDVGSVNGSTFLNNVSLGVYAVAVGSDDYRAHKVTALIGAAREAWSDDEGGRAELSIEMPTTSALDDEQGTSTVLIVNNAYAPTFAPGARLRPRLDGGEVWVYVGGGLPAEGSLLTKVSSVVGAAMSKTLLRAAYGAPRIVVSSDDPDVPVAVDGELRADLGAPFAFASHPGALRLLVPTDPSPAPLSVHLSW